jgi:hypothetical protein
LANKHYYIALVVLVLCVVKPTRFWAQNTELDKQKIIEQRIELISENLESEDIDLNTLLDNLFYYFDHPINLNSKRVAEKLREIELLTEIQINNLTEHIRKNGKLLSIYELQAVPGFDVNTIKLILPFVKVDISLSTPNFSFSEIKNEGKHEIISRWQKVLEKQAGYRRTEEEKLRAPNSYFLGSNDRLYFRYRFQYLNNVSLGITGDKDPGEQFFRGTQKYGFDFYSAHFYVRNVNRFKAIAIGDYQAQFGQGLTLWTGLAFGKTLEITSIKRNAQGLRPYASVDESRFLRGAAVSYELRNFTFTALASRKKIDGNVLAEDTLNNDIDVLVSSFQQSGFHRTNSEIRNKNALTETHVGGNISFDKGAFHMGATAIKTQYSGFLQRSPSNYNQFDFNGNNNSAFGVDYNWVIRNLNFFGESAMSENGAMAHLHGALVALDPKLNLSILYRNYDRAYQNLTYNALSESSNGRNEEGLLIGFDMKMGSTFTFSGYFDQFTFDWMRFQTDKPFTHGYDFIGQLRYKPNKKLDIYGRYRYRNKPINTDAENIVNINPVFFEYRENIRLNIDYKVSDDWQLRSRVEHMNFERIGGAKESGFLAYQDVFYTPKGKPLSVKLRYAMFDTDSYSSRIYAYESDLLYVFSVPAHYFRGSRYYIMARYKFNKKFDLWVRFSRWIYDNQTTISNGINQIDGNMRSEIKVQLVIRL